MTLFEALDSFEHQHDKSLSFSSPNCGSLLWFHLLSDKVFGKSDGSQVTKTLITAARMYTVSTFGHDPLLMQELFRVLKRQTKINCQRSFLLSLLYLLKNGLKNYGDFPCLR